jgi:LPS O-antigen subunit length determinant protein (WzzB/FepE family)
MNDRSHEAATPTLREDDEVLDLMSLSSKIWQGKWLIIGVTAAFTLSSAGLVLTLQSWYRAEVLLAPVRTKSAADLAGPLGSLGGLASLAGLTLGGNTSEPLAVLESRDLAREFVEQQNLLPVFFARRWDAKLARWTPADPQDWPDVRDGVKYLINAVRTVKEDKKTGLVTLTIEWKDAKTAADWANLYADRANERIRARALLEAQANVDFLEHELATTSVVTLQQSIGRLLDTELQKVMLARENKEFAFRVIDRAEVPKWRVWPKRVQTVALATVIGGALSTYLVLLRDTIRRRRGAVTQPTV